MRITRTKPDWKRPQILHTKGKSKKKQIILRIAEGSQRKIKIENQEKKF